MWYNKVIDRSMKIYIKSKWNTIESTKKGFGTGCFQVPTTSLNNLTSIIQGKSTFTGEKYSKFIKFKNHNRNIFALKKGHFSFIS